MKIYEIIIKPKSGFGTSLKGDTIFGHFCWQIIYDSDLIGMTLNEFLLHYDTDPLIIFSSMYPKFYRESENAYYYALKTPDLPLDELFVSPKNSNEKIKRGKEYKAKKWMIVKEGQKFASFKDILLLKLNEKELLKEAGNDLTQDVKKIMKKSVNNESFVVKFNQYHNRINRLINTTDNEGFAPFVMEQQVFYPETELALFVGFDENVINIDGIRMGLERIGVTGFGRDASTGLGRFELGEDSEIELSGMGSDKPNACYTLSPCVPQRDTFSTMYFSPFVRFGKHGDVLAKSLNPFKNPIIMVDEGAILKPKNNEIFNKPYVGTAVNNISKAEPKSVAQGYSLYIPVRVEV